jgi:peptidoglycan hydrolase-like protein with peptidoglycan-binding domain
MGVLVPRLVFLAFVGLTGSIMYNALYLQDLHGSATLTATSLPQQAPSTPAIAPPAEVVKLPPPVSTDLPPIQVEEGGPEATLKAVQRELAARGFDVGAADGKPSDKTRAAISAYEKGHGLAVTGTASDELLRHILLGDTVQPSGSTGSVAAAFDDGAKTKDSTVKAVQQILADLGYAPGPIDGALGGSTTRAISAFQRDRKIAVTGRLSPELLRELKRITGRDLTKTAASH